MTPDPTTLASRVEPKDTKELLDPSGGPAFPISLPGWGDNGAHGMSLRDWFAGHAMMAGLGQPFSGGEGSYIERVATAAYEMADAMLKVRSVTRGGSI